jgi:hypothetical protein
MASETEHDGTIYCRNSPNFFLFHDLEVTQEFCNYTTSNMCCNVRSTVHRCVVTVKDTVTKLSVLCVGMRVWQFVSVLLI